MKRLLLFNDDVVRMTPHLLCQRETVLTQFDACTLVVAFPTLSDIGQCQTPSACGLDPPSRIMDAAVSAFVSNVFVLEATRALARTPGRGRKARTQPLHLDTLVADRQALQHRLGAISSRVNEACRDSSPTARFGSSAGPGKERRHDPHTHSDV
ncbi:hypothetical protein RFN28_20540 [Mesorhizobium sp. VK24D]|uniref:Uncharacterized protein n=1 Tax=Mesorhizobium album TaxID=3072314 RepID=A0ABU4Y1J4_9HYPH|nr:hypothetical protein [Mesorhizobium sp. VK24D]MDX8480829.1 hypothetical protein [Mesorhizobium sp. VK24D]